jgi:shikimate dehydrogenase
VRAAVLGSPIAHSLSPVLHRAAYQALGLDDWTYEIVECDEAALPGVLEGDWAGLSLTMPLKRAVLPLLDDIEPLAVEVGGANTVVYAPGGRRHGYNTDVHGMVTALAEAGVTAPDGVESAGASGRGAGSAWASGRGATILGAGATACAALAALRDLGLAEAVVLARDPARAGDLLAAALRLGMVVDVRPLTEEIRGGDLLISTLPAGAADFISERHWHGDPTPSAVLDVVYAPWPTQIAIAAAKAGVPVASGGDMLLHQAARQVELMTGRTPAPVEHMRAALSRVQ